MRIQLLALDKGSLDIVDEHGVRFVQRRNLEEGSAQAREIDERLTQDTERVDPELVHRIVRGRLARIEDVARRDERRGVLHEVAIDDGTEEDAGHRELLWRVSLDKLVLVKERVQSTGKHLVIPRVVRLLASLELLDHVVNLEILAVEHALVHLLDLQLDVFGVLGDREALFLFGSGAEVEQSGMQDQDVGPEVLESANVFRMKAIGVAHDTDEYRVDVRPERVHQRGDGFGLMLVIKLEPDLVFDKVKDPFEEVVALDGNAIGKPLFQVEIFLV
jgi:hypothetical protein